MISKVSKKQNKTLQMTRSLSKCCLSLKNFSLQSLFSIQSFNLRKFLAITGEVLKAVICNMPLLTCMAELCWVDGWMSKAKGPWKWPWKNSGPLDHFRIEDQNFEGFWSISQLLFIGFGKRVWICLLQSYFLFNKEVFLSATNRVYKNSQEIDLN